jgi:hypothetical protein
MRAHLLALAVLCLPATSAAESLHATPAQLASAEHVASVYWHGNPACGAPVVTYEPMADTHAGEAEYGSCRIMLNPAHDWRDFPALLCVVLAHEWGHLVLGPDYFAAVNPSDPAHSPDPRNIMNAAGPAPGTFAPCEGRLHKARRVRHRRSA